MCFEDSNGLDRVVCKAISTRLAHTRVGYHDNSYALFTVKLGYVSVNYDNNFFIYPRQYL